MGSGSFEASTSFSHSVAFFLKLYLMTPNSPLGHTMAIAVLSLDYPVYPDKRIFSHIINPRLQLFARLETRV